MVQSAKDLRDLVNKLLFWKIKSKIQRQLSKDIRVINRWSKVLVFAVKASKIYGLGTDEYKKLTTEVVRLSYKKVLAKINDKINTERKRIKEKKTALNGIASSLWKSYC